MIGITHQDYSGGQIKGEMFWRCRTDEEEKYIQRLGL
jgi:hypothetical protein